MLPHSSLTYQKQGRIKETSSLSIPLNVRAHDCWSKRAIPCSFLFSHSWISLIRCIKRRSNNNFKKKDKAKSVAKINHRQKRGGLRKNVSHHRRMLEHLFCSSASERPSWHLPQLSRCSRPLLDDHPPHVTLTASSRRELRSERRAWLPVENQVACFLLFCV